MDHVECRRMICAAFLLSTGMHLFLAGHCASAEPGDLVMPLILPVEVHKETAVESFWSGPKLPFLEEPVALSEPAQAAEELNDLRPIPSHSQHWTADATKTKSVFEDALILPAEYQPWNWQEEYTNTPAPKRLNFDDAETCTDEELAKTQKEFRDLVQCGLLEEANRVLKRMEKAKPAGKEMVEMDLYLHDARYGQKSNSKLRHHVVGYEDVSGDYVYRYRQVYQPPSEPKNWDAVASAEISFHFQGATIGEVALFFHHVMGVTVRVEDVAMESSTAHNGVYIRCRNKTAEQGLRVVLGSRGLGYLYRNGELVIATPATINQTIRSVNNDVETYWVP
jgi:hypothetical protein